MNMLDQVFDIIQRIEPLEQRRNPQVAAMWGLALGGLGLAIYLRSVIDFVIPVLAVVPLIYLVGDLGWLVGAALAAGYGYFRVVTSNELLAARGAESFNPGALQ